MPMQRFFPYWAGKNEVQPSGSGVYQKILPNAGQCTAIEVEVKATNGATSNKANILPMNISRIEITGDGVDKILSLDGYAAMKYVWVTTGRRPEGVYDENPAVVQVVRYMFLMGRMFNDPQFMLNLSKYKQVRVDVTYNLATVRAQGATGFAAGAPTISVVAHMTPPGITLTSSGCRRVVERLSSSGAASGDLPWTFVQDYSYTNVYVYARKAGTADGTVVSNIVLDLGAGKPILYNHDWDNLERIMAKEFYVDPLFDLNAFAKDTDVVIMHTGRIRRVEIEEPAVATIGTTATPHYTPNTVAGDQVTVQAYTIVGTGTWGANAAITSELAVTMKATGFNCGNIVTLPMADIPGWDNAMSPADLGTAQLRITQGAASSQIYVITEQILPQ